MCNLPILYIHIILTLTGRLVGVQCGHRKTILPQVPDGHQAVLTSCRHDVQLTRVLVHAQQADVLVRPRRDKGMYATAQTVSRNQSCIRLIAQENFLTFNTSQQIYMPDIK